MNEPMSEMPRGERRPAPNSGWERSVLEKMALELVVERRRARRWSIFFRLLLVAYIGLMTVIWMGLWRPGGEQSGPGISLTGNADTGPRHTALVRIDGVIKADGRNSADNINEALRAAFRDPNTAGVVLEINSPGGSPVQSALIYEEMRRLREEFPTTELHVVVGEVCASGGYYVAAAADKIHVSAASLVGSIGVLMDGFGFVGAMHKLGVERRLFSAGENKGFMDSFSPVSERDREHLQALLDQIHRQFIDAVKQGRGERLKSDPSLFTGLVWTGQKAIELGLADDIGTRGSLARDVFKAERVIDYTERDPLLQRIGRRLGIAFGSGVGDGVREELVSPGWR
ncbi:MAG: S49 family peptidase [Burkholderiaceae bacterium]